MRCKLISTGWDCEQFIDWTLLSITGQTVKDYDLHIVDDCTPGHRQAAKIEQWCENRDNWSYTINPERYGAVRSQYEGIVHLNPAADDIIVWIDLDGDKLAHPSVLDNLMTAYSDGSTRLTYGSYRPVPDMGTSIMATPFPDHVVQQNSYRDEILRRGCHFNQIRTMRGDVFWSIPQDHFKWPPGTRHVGEWYTAGTDYIFMTAGLERAGGNYKFLPEVLYIYNHANPHSIDPEYHLRSSECTENYLRREVLSPL